MQWLDRFLAACTGCRVDFIASHYCTPLPADSGRLTELMCFSECEESVLRIHAARLLPALSPSCFA